MIGGYVSLIESCVEAGDLSPLNPMSVKDLIWVNVCQSLRLKRKYEFEKVKHEVRLKDLEQLMLMLADLRAISYDTNGYVRIAAMSGTKARKVDMFRRDALPSIAIAKQREEEEKTKNMTPEELALYRFNKGEKIKG